MQMVPLIQNILIKCLKMKTEDFVFASRYSLNGKTDDDTFLTFLGNKVFTTIGNIFFRLKFTIFCLLMS